MHALPKPAAEELQLSQRLRSHILHEIAVKEGWISFTRFMELALYTPGLGYYTGGANKFGEGGDFVTAPGISALFGRTLSQPLGALLQEIPGGILELGAGDAKLAIHILKELETRQGLLPPYYILEISGELQQRQQQAIERHIPHLAKQVQWLDKLPQHFKGAVLANEVFDALPTSLVYWGKETILERGVSASEDRFIWQDRPLTSAELYAIAQSIQVPSGYLSEINLRARSLMRTLASILEEGAVLILDYGFPQHEYYHPQRNCGTVMCHYRHYAHDDPFFLPGLQDITSHVDFTALAHEAVDAGLSVLGYATQAQFLLDCGILNLLEETPADNVSEYSPLAAQVQKLLSPAEMGELFKVLILKKGSVHALDYLASGNRSLGFGL